MDFIVNLPSDKIPLSSDEKDVLQWLYPTSVETEHPVTEKPNTEKEVIVQNKISHELTGLTISQCDITEVSDDFLTNLTQLESSPFFVTANLAYMPTLNPLPKLKNFDWRVDIKTASDLVPRMSYPTCIVQLKVYVYVMYFVCV